MEKFCSLCKQFVWSNYTLTNSLATPVQSKEMVQFLFGGLISMLYNDTKPHMQASDLIFLGDSPLQHMRLNLASQLYLATYEFPWKLCLATV
jgi:hypothetical protein